MWAGGHLPAGLFIFLRSQSKINKIIKYTIDYIVLMSYNLKNVSSDVAGCFTAIFFILLCNQ